MFTGIIEQIVKVVDLKKEAGNMHYFFESDITNELKIEQSLAHKGGCLTVVDINADVYLVTAIKETLEKTNLGLLALRDKVNLERSIQIGGRLDGHMVQGHVDQTAVCTEIKENRGSYIFTFEYKDSENIIVEKGSVCVNGVSLTAFNLVDNSFSVAIIPYTFENTNFIQLILEV